MKTLIASSAALLVAATASAGVYTDATFDLFDNGFDNLDISSVSVTDNGTDITFSVTTRGFREDEVRAVARWMCEVMDHMDDPAVIADVRGRVKELCQQFPVYSA